LPQRFAPHLDEERLFVLSNWRGRKFAIAPATAIALRAVTHGGKTAANMID
jgi:hypothetical protein